MKAKTEKQIVVLVTTGGVYEIGKSYNGNHMEIYQNMEVQTIQLKRDGIPGINRLPGVKDEPYYLVTLVEVSEGGEKEKVLYDAVPYREVISITFKEVLVSTRLEDGSREINLIRE